MELNTLLVDVVLIDLISDDKDIVLIAYVNYFLDVFLGKYLSCRISRVDNNDRTNVYSSFLCISDLLLHIIGIK